MTDMLQGNSNQTPDSSDDPPYERRTPTKASPQRARAPSKRTHAQKATRQLLAAQLQAKCSALRDHQPLEAAHTALDQQAESLMSGSPDEWHPSRGCAPTLYCGVTLYCTPSDYTAWYPTL